MSVCACLHLRIVSRRLWLLIIFFHSVQFNHLIRWLHLSRTVLNKIEREKISFGKIIDFGYDI